MQVVTFSAMAAGFDFGLDRGVGAAFALLTAVLACRALLTAVLALSQREFNQVFDITINCDNGS